MSYTIFEQFKQGELVFALEMESGESMHLSQTKLEDYAAKVNNIISDELNGNIGEGDDYTIADDAKKKNIEKTLLAGGIPLEFMSVSDLLKKLRFCGVASHLQNTTAVAFKGDYSINSMWPFPINGSELYVTVGRSITDRGAGQKVRGAVEVAPYTSENDDNGLKKFYVGRLIHPPAGTFTPRVPDENVQLHVYVNAFK